MRQRRQTCLDIGPEDWQYLEWLWICEDNRRFGPKHSRTQTLKLGRGPSSHPADCPDSSVRAVCRVLGSVFHYGNGVITYLLFLFYPLIQKVIHLVIETITSLRSALLPACSYGPKQPQRPEHVHQGLYRGLLLPLLSPVSFSGPSKARSTPSRQLRMPTAH